MRKVRLFILLALLSATLKGLADSNIMFDKANQLYHNKNYDSACKLYQQMINDGYCSADLYYNAGNAYYRANKVGMSIWCYEKSIQIHPTKNTLDNLALAQQRIKEPIDNMPDIFFIRWWRKIYGLLSVNAWAILALSSFLLAMIPLFVRTFKPAIQFPKFISRSLLSISLLSLLLMGIASYNETYHFRAVVVQENTLITFSNKREPIYLNAGIIVRAVERNNHRILVRLPDSREGYISRDAILKL